MKQKGKNFSVNRERLMKTFMELARIPSPSWKENGVINYLIRRFQKLDIDFEKYQCGESFNILARMEGNVERESILLSAHMDTVTPCEGVMPVVSKSRITSDGKTILGADDKAAIASFLEGMQTIRERKIDHGPVEFLFSCAEETGLYGMKGFDTTLLRSRLAFVFDSDGDIGRIILEAPFHVTYEVTVTGKAVHAGLEPEKGISAIRILSNIISKLPHGRIDRSSTVNVGIISGGKATNIVAERAFCKLEARSLSKGKLSDIETRIKTVIRNECARGGARFSLCRNMEYAGFTIGRSQRIVKLAVGALKKIGLAPVYVSSGGGSDTNILNRAGIRAVNLSIGMRNPHSRNEYILIRDLVNGARMVLALIDSV